MTDHTSGHTVDRGGSDDKTRIGRRSNPSNRPTYIPPNKRSHLALSPNQPNQSAIMPSSHRRHGQDKTVLSCPCRWCELNCDKSRQFSVVLNTFETEQFCRVPHFETGQNCKKRNMSSFEIFLTCLQLFSSHRVRRHGQDNTRQSCLVRVGGVNWQKQRPKYNGRNRGIIRYATNHRSRR